MPHTTVPSHRLAGLLLLTGNVYVVAMLLGVSFIGLIGRASAGRSAALGKTGFVGMWQGRDSGVYRVALDHQPERAAALLVLTAVRVQKRGGTGKSSSPAGLLWFNVLHAHVDVLA